MAALNSKKTSEDGVLSPKVVTQSVVVQNQVCQKKMKDKIVIAKRQNVPVYSFEYFPAKNAAAMKNLRDRICRMELFDPLFIDITDSKSSNSKTLELAKDLLKETNINVIMVHLTMTDRTKVEIIEYLNECKNLGIRNILALRGDPSPECDSWEPCETGLDHACDLVKLIRKEFGDFFHIGVGGYPEGHPNSESLDKDIEYLRQKVIAGADSITTQFFYDCDVFFNFVEKCRNAGIKVPIIPGFMPIQTYGTFVRIVSHTNVKVPDSVWKDLKPIKDNDSKVKEYGIQYCTKMCQTVLNYFNEKQNNPMALHFYTFNLERSVTKILEKLKLLCFDKPNTNNNNNNNDNNNNNKSENDGRNSEIKKNDDSNNNNNKSNNRERGMSDDGSNFPWQSAINISRRTQETVRPIFWSNRNESYIRRTQHWDEYPNGRWGDNRSPAYGEFPNHYLLKQGHSKLLQSKQYRQSMWQSELQSFNDVYNVFVKYLNCEIKQLPWCMEPIKAETSTYLLQSLKLLNKYGFLTINSQPQVNAAPSNDNIVGWGPNNGYVYQKAYLEFFVSKEKLDKLLSILTRNENDNCTNNERNKNDKKDDNSVNNNSKYGSILYQAVNKENDLKTNCNLTDVNAVTWGVFAGSEIIQPTIVDTQSFLAWKDEAFSLWKTYWQCIYEKESKSYKLIDTICEEWYLVNIVENDFIFGNIFAVFEDYFCQTIKDVNELKKIKQTLKDTHNAQQNIMYSRSIKSHTIVDSSSNNQCNEHNPYLDASLLTMANDESKDDDKE